MYQDCERCEGDGEIIAIGLGPPIATCPDCGGNGYVESEVEDDEQPSDKYIDIDAADIAAGQHFEARGY